MKQRLRFFGSYAIFWIFYFVIARFLFLLYENSLSFDLEFKEWILTFVHGLRMDISATGYILGVIGLILIFTSITNGKWINRITQPLTIILLIITSGIVVSDLELYNNWGYRMDATPLLYITKPKEAMASTELWLSIVLLVGTVLLVFLGNFYYKKLIKPSILKIQKARFIALPLLILLTGSMILPVRGSLGIAPMNTGMVYFSTNKFANHAAINVVWNVMHSLVHKENEEKTYHFMDDPIAKEIVDDLNSFSDSSEKVLTINRPNVVVLILESFSSKVITELGGKWNAAPNFDKLIKEGLVFDHFYANASRSDKGIVSVLSAYPGQPTTSIIKTPSKTESLPSLFKTFNNNGYKTSFYYGGDIDFANMRSYFLNADAKTIISVENFESKLNNSKWGVHDEHLFNYLYEDLVNETKPFFSTVFTLSSHDPFEVPMEAVFNGNDRATKYLNSIYYTDSCLGHFFDRIKQTKVWNNTLFILVADHGSTRPGNSQNHDIDKFEIPMLWLGGVLNDSIQVNSKVGSQIDIPATLLNQLGLPFDDFKYSKDLFSYDSGEFAFYVFNDGFSFITDTTKVIFDNTGNNILLGEGDYHKDLTKGKAYLQELMNDFISR